MNIPARYLRRFHAVVTLVWLTLVPPSIIWWKESITWVVMMSVWANVAAHFSAWQATRAEENGDNG